MSINFDRVADRYDETRGGVERGAAVAAEIAPHLPDDGLVLEIGVGTGLVASAIERDVVGVDISEAMLDLARPRIGARAARADGLALPFPPGTFAGGYAVWVLHLIADRPAFFAEVRRVLQTGGRFVARLTHQFAHEGDIQPILSRLFTTLLGPPRDTPEQVAAAAETAGLTVVAVETTEETLEQSPAEIVDAIEARTGSAFWAVTDEQWTELVEPVLDELRALPDQHVTRARRSSHATVVVVA